MNATREEGGGGQAARSAASLKKNAAARFLAEGVMLVVFQASAIVVARSLGPTGKGLASLLALIITVVIMAVDLGLTSAGVYFVGRRKYSAQSVVSTFLAVGALTGIAAALALGGLRYRLAGLIFGGRYDELILILAIGGPAALLYNWLSGVLRGQERIVAVSCVNVIGAAAGLSALVLALYALHLGTASIVWGMNATAVLGLVACAYLLSRQGIRFNLKLDRALIRDCVGYGLRGQVGQILQFINYRFDLLVVNYFLGIASVGIYGVGAGVAQLIWQIPNSLSFALYSRVSSVSRDEGNAITHKVARQSMLLSLLAALLLIPAGYVGVPLLFGESFRPAIVATWLLLPGVVALSYYKTLGVHMAGQGHPEYYSYGAATSAVVTLTLDFLLVPRIGINGAAIASSVAYTLSAAICVYWFVRTTGMTNVARLFVPEASDLKTYLHWGSSDG
jgi:O-antigen/teichoic acid export membrane protein